MIQSPQPLRILFAGGGTGGHVMPIATVIQSIQQGEYPPYQLYRYGNSDSLESRTIQQLNQSLSTPVVFRSLVSGKIRRDHSVMSMFRNIRDMICVGWGTLQALWYLFRDHIDVIRCKGGHVAGPVIFASRILRIPLIVHESDTRMGLINRLASRHAEHIYTAFPGVHPRAEMIGQLLSDTFASGHDRSEFLSLIGRSTHSHQTHVLVMGGSQGSLSLYQSLAQAMRSRPDIYSAYTFVVVGGLLSEDLATLFFGLENVVVLDFLSAQRLTLCYQYCDISLTRAGTTSLAEQKLRDMLLIMVPIPWTHDQKTNAERYVEHHNDILIEQNENLITQMDLIFTALRAYRKTPTQTDISRMNHIRRPKQKLIQTLFMYAD